MQDNVHEDDVVAGDLNRRDAVTIYRAIRDAWGGFGDGFHRCGGMNFRDAHEFDVDLVLSSPQRGRGVDIRNDDGDCSVVQQLCATFFKYRPRHAVKNLLDTMFADPEKKVPAIDVINFLNE